jgi:hypothetical protein
MIATSRKPQSPPDAFMVSPIPLSGLQQAGGGFVSCAHCRHRIPLSPSYRQAISVLAGFLSEGRQEHRKCRDATGIADALCCHSDDRSDFADTREEVPRARRDVEQDPLTQQTALRHGGRQGKGVHSGFTRVIT